MADVRRTAAAAVHGGVCWAGLCDTRSGGSDACRVGRRKANQNFPTGDIGGNELVAGCNRTDTRMYLTASGISGANARGKTFFKWSNLI